MLENILKEIQECNDLEKLEAIKKEYIGKKGKINLEMKNLKDLEPEMRKTRGQELGAMKTEVEKHINQKFDTLYIAETNKQLEKEIVDITTNGKKISQGHFTKVQNLRREVEDIFHGMGFDIAYGNEVVSKYENFFSLNIPATHPATEMHDTFYLQQKDETEQNYVLRTHTSSWQNQIMKDYELPIKVAIPGKVFRYEATDASHDNTFWQLEGLVIDEDMTIAKALDLMKEFFSALFGSNVKIRLRPAFFPFVEPGFEGDASCPICNQEGCSLCSHTGWIEIFGAGMVHPNVLKEGGIDPEKYTGFAFGMGLTRLVSIKHTIKDIRLFHNGDLRFVRS